MKRKVRSQSRRRRGFTLLEILLVLAILVVLAGIVAVNVGGLRTGAFKNAAKTQLSNFESALETYQLQVGTYPSSLEALHAQPSDLADPSKWTQIIKKEIPKDPWDNAYIYKLNGATYELRSAGPDGQENTEDDVTL